MAAAAGALALPKRFVICSLFSHKYLSYSDDNPDVYPGVRAPQFTNESCESPYTRFEMEEAEDEDYKTKGYVHIKCTALNKYWAAPTGPDDNYWIDAAGNQREEDVEKDSCTLFEPILKKHNDPTVVYFRDVRSQLYVANNYAMKNEHPPSRNGLQVCWSTQISDDKLGFEDYFKVIDPDSILTLPKIVMLKGDNGKYLKVYPDHKMHLLSFDTQKADDGDPFLMYETVPGPAGYTFIKSRKSQKLWRCYNPDKPGQVPWIMADSEESDRYQDIDSKLFFPVRLLGENVFAFRCKLNDKYIQRVDGEGQKSCLGAHTNTIDQYSRMILEEPVRERVIRDMIFDNDKRRTYDPTVQQVISGIFSNDDDESSGEVITHELKYEVTRKNTTNLYSSHNISGGVSATIETGIKFLAEGKIEVEASGSWEKGKGEATEKLITTTHSDQVELAHGQATMATLVLSEESCEIPYSYTQCDTLWNGETIEHRKRVGICRTKSYNFDVHQTDYRKQEPKEMEAHSILPRFIVISLDKPGMKYRHLCHYSVAPRVVLYKEPPTSTFSTFEVEPAEDEQFRKLGYVHIRCFGSDEYWQRSKDSNFIDPIGGCSPRVEDVKSEECTLFEPILKSSHDQDHKSFLVYFRHVFSKCFLIITKPPGETEADYYGGVLQVATTGSEFTLFKVMDSASVLTLPKHILLKADNKMYLRSNGNSGHLSFDTEDPTKAVDDLVFETYPLSEDFIQIKAFYGYSWRCISPELEGSGLKGVPWIVTNEGLTWTSSGEVIDKRGPEDNIYFLPERVKDNVITLRCRGNSHYCKRLTSEDRVSGLAAEKPTDDQGSHFVVEEPVVSRVIQNVDYRADMGRRYGDQITNVMNGKVANDVSKLSGGKLTHTVEYTYQTVTTTNSKTTWGASGGVKTTIKAGIPFVEEGGFTVQAGYSYEHEKETTETMEVTMACQVVVPVEPASARTISVVATEGKMDIPYSYDQVDNLWNGKKVTYRKDDGIYTKKSCMNYHVKVSRIGLHSDEYAKLPTLPSKVTPAN